ESGAVAGAAELPGFGYPATGTPAGQPSQPSAGGIVSGHSGPADVNAGSRPRPGSRPPDPHHASEGLGLASFREPAQQKAAGGLADVPGAVSAGAPAQANSAAGHGAVPEATGSPSNRAIASAGTRVAKRHRAVQIPGVPVLADTP